MQTCRWPLNYSITEACTSPTSLAGVRGVWMSESLFDTRYLVFYNPSPPRMFSSLNLLWEYRIQHGANGPLYVTSSYSTWIFSRGVSGLAIDFPCGVLCRGLTTCLLHVGPPFGNRILNNSWAVDLTWWIINPIFVFWHMQLYMSWYIRSFFGFTFLNILYFFKYSCTNIFHRRSLYTFYSIELSALWQSTTSIKN